MNYYRRYDENGNCEVICTRCFATVGIAGGFSDARKIEALHLCGRKTNQDAPKIISIDSAVGRPPASFSNPVERMFGPSGKLKNLNTWILFLLAVLFLYAIPTVFELAATKHFNPWLAVILPGDAIGCACLITGFRMPRTGFALYLLLTICEAALYGSKVVATRDLIWLVDLVPTITVACLIMRTRMLHGIRHRNFLSTGTKAR